MVKCSFTNLTVVGSSPVAVTYTSDMVPDLRKEFLDIYGNKECVFTSEGVRDMRITNSDIQRTDK